MNATTIRERIKHKCYDAKVSYPANKVPFKVGHIFDENMSVKWNKGEVERLNTEIEVQNKAYSDSVTQGAHDFDEDLLAYILEDYSINANRAIAEKIVSKAYEEGHSGGLYEVLNYAIDMADYAVAILNLYKNQVK